MPEIKPSISRMDMLCADMTAPPGGMIVFGASGDLAGRKLLPGLFELFRRGLIGEQFFLAGCGRKELSDEQFRGTARRSIETGAAGASPEKMRSFIERLYYVSGDYNDISAYQKIRVRISELAEKYKAAGNIVFYLAVPPLLYGTIVAKLGEANLACCEDYGGREGIKLVVEKPFGRDLTSAVELNDAIRRCFDESQIYRIDHYLGKETVQNILMFRFANTIFEPVWNCKHIDSVQITIAETVGVEHRGGYYDKTGALRDMFQNHILQMLCLVAMEPPTSFEADRIRDEKAKTLQVIRPFRLDELNRLIVRGQYGSGSISGRAAIGYRSEPYVQPQSQTETFVAAKLFVDNKRWKAVPFYLRTGKRLAKKSTEIAITFKNIPHSMFVSAGLTDIPANVLVLQIQPDEGISLSFQAKRPGSKICMSTLNMSFSYGDIFGVEMPEAYQRLLLDCLAGDQTLFMRFDSVELAWQLLTGVLEIWEQDSSMPHEYPAGSESFPQADDLIQSDGRSWRRLIRDS